MGAPKIKKFRKNHRTLLEKRRGVSEYIAFGVMFFIFTVYALCIIFLFAWAIMSSLKANREFFQYPFALPKDWLFSNYVEAFKVLRFGNTNFIGMIFNSLWLTSSSLFLSLMMCSLTGYVFARYDFRGKNIIYAVAIFVMVIPLMGSGAAGYRLIYALGLNDSPLYLITSLGGFGMTFIILNGVFKGIPKDYMEASFIDGGGHLYTYVRIMLPMAVAPISALAITGFIGGWNDYMTTIMYMEKFPTLAAGLYFYQRELEYASNEPLYFAGALMCAVPVLTIFAIFQNKFMENISVGGLKG